MILAEFEVIPMWTLLFLPSVKNDRTDENFIFSAQNHATVHIYNDRLNSFSWTEKSRRSSSQFFR